MSRPLISALVTGTILLCAGVHAQSPPDLPANITRLSSLDYPTRMNAARAIRRLPPAQAVPALVEAVTGNRDEFVRYRAFILLSSFNDRGTAVLVQKLLDDANDRLREAAYKWIEAHPDPAMVPRLLSALQAEQAEFVRPALVSALATMGDDVRVQRALLGEIGRGLDFFRAAVIDALGRRRATYATDAIAAVAKLQGPLQDDAVLALGRIGGSRAQTALTPLMDQSPSPGLAITIRAALCLAGQPCEPQVARIVESMGAGAPAAVVRAGVSGLTAIAARGDQAVTGTLVALANQGGVVRDQAALGLATVAVMDPDHVITWLDRMPEGSRESAINLLKDGFDDLEEDFGEEQFFASARARYWKAAEGSDTRSLTALLIQRLEF